MREYKYFVSFYQRDSGRDTISNAIITSSKKIDCLDDIYNIEKKLIEFGESEKTTVKLISITLL